MQDLLSSMIGRKVDVVCVGTSNVSGEIVGVEGGVLRMKDDNQDLCYVAIDKISVVWEARDGSHRAGFVSITPAR